MKKIVVALNFWRLILPIYIYCTDKEFRSIVKADLSRALYSYPNSSASLYWFMYALVLIPQFRAVCYFRFRQGHDVARIIQQVILPNRREVEITGDIGPGLLVYHGQATILHCAKAGENLSVGHSVTVGRQPSHKRDGVDLPSFGDNVTIYAGSIIIGGIRVGNNVEIGAGSIVTKDIPDDCTVVGNPARIIKRNGKRVNEPLIWLD